MNVTHRRREHIKVHVHVNWSCDLHTAGPTQTKQRQKSHILACHETRTKSYFIYPITSNIFFGIFY